MAARNRVAPSGAVVAAPGRGAWTGNRGVLHAAGGDRRIVREFQVRRWITCQLEFRGRRIPQWAPGRYTPLFLADEAVAFAAGHRPCSECRHADAVAFRDAWAAAAGGRAPRVDAMDRVLHAQRLPVDGTHPGAWADLPDGTFVVLDAGPAVVVGDRVTPFDVGAYRYLAPAASARPRSGTVAVRTPAAVVDALRAGYVAQVDAAAR